MQDVKHIEDYFDLADEQFAEAIGCKIEDIPEVKKQLVLAQKLPPKRLEAFENMLLRMKTVRPAFLENKILKEMEAYRQRVPGAFGMMPGMQDGDPDGVDGPYGAE